MPPRTPRWLMVVLLVCLLGGVLPGAAESHERNVIAQTDAATVLVLPAGLPRPDAARSTGLAAAVVDQSLRAAYQATHTLAAAVDGTFSAVRTETAAYGRTVALSGLRASSTTIRIPPGIRDSLKLDLTLTQSGSPFGASMRLAVAPAGTTSWSNDLTVLRLEGSGTVHAERLQVSLDQSVPVAQPMDLRLECLGDYLISCRWENLRFFNDAPGWTPQPTNRHHPEILVGARASPLGAIPPRHGPFLGIEVTALSWDDLDYSGPRLAFPSFTATDPVTVSLDWARTSLGSASQIAPGGAELRFLPDGETDSALIATVDSAAAAVAWTTLVSAVPARFAGQHGGLKR